MNTEQTINEPCLSVPDYDPRQAANNAAEDLLYVIQRHPEVTTAHMETLGPAYRLLKEFADA